MRSSATADSRSTKRRRASYTADDAALDAALDASAEAPLVIEQRTPQSPDAALVVLHGFDDTPESCAKGLAAARKAHPSWKSVYMRAPERAITAFDGKLHRAFGDFVDAGAVAVGSADYEAADCKGWYAQSVAAVRDTVATLKAEGVPPERVLLVGYSQGGAVAAQAALSLGAALGGVAILGGWLTVGARASLESLAGMLHVFVAHGTADEQVSYGCGIELARQLAATASTVRLYCVEGARHVESFARASRKAAEWVEEVLTLAQGDGAAPPVSAVGGCATTPAAATGLTVGTTIEVYWTLHLGESEEPSFVWWTATVQAVDSNFGGAARLQIVYRAQHGFDEASTECIFTGERAPLWDIGEMQLFDWRYQAVDAVSGEAENEGLGVRSIIYE